MSTKYPSYSVYIQTGGQLKKPYGHYGLAKRVEIFEKEEALHAAVKIWNHYKGNVDVVVLRFDRPYKSTIVHCVNRKEDDSSR